MTNAKKIVHDMIGKNSIFAETPPPNAKCQWCGSKNYLVPLSHSRQGPSAGEVNSWVCHQCVVKNWWGGQDPYHGDTKALDRAFSRK